MSKEDAPNFSELYNLSCDSCTHSFTRISIEGSPYSFCVKYDFKLPNDSEDYRCDSWEGE